MRILFFFLISLSFTNLTLANSSGPLALVTQYSANQLWDTLNPHEQKLLSYLVQATQTIKPVLFFQSHRHALKVRSFLLKTFSANQVLATKKLLTSNEFSALSRYAAEFLIKKGPYEEYANKKNLLTGISEEKLKKLWKRANIKVSKKELEEIVKLLTDPTFEATEYPDSPDGTGLEKTGGNLYEHGLTPAEINEAVKQGLKLANNCRLVRNKATQKLACQRLAADEKTLPVEVREALLNTAKHLKTAAKFSDSATQRTQLGALASLFLHGDMKDAAIANKALVTDSIDTKIRLYAEFIYVMFDFRGAMAKLEFTVMSTNAELTKVTQGLTKNAAYFEEKFPYGDYRREFPADYSPGIWMLQSLMRAGQGSEDPGLHLEAEENGKPLSLNIIPGYPPELTVHPVYAADLRERLSLFHSKEDVELTLKYFNEAITRLVLLHEHVGHGSGKIDPEKYKGEDPYTAMGAEGTSAEEMRANLASFAVFCDPKMIELGLAASEQELKDLLRAWLTQNISTIATFAAQGNPMLWPHMRGNFFLINYWIEKGVLEFKDGIFTLKDVDQLVQVSLPLLEEIQKLRATRDKTTLDQRYAQYAPTDATQKPWVKEVLGKADHLSTNVLVIYQPFEVTKKGFRFQGNASKLETLIPWL